MKKQLFLLLTIVVATFAFVSCSNDDDDNQYESAIVGTWKITEVKTSQSGTYISWPFKATYASFKSDGTYYGSGYFGAGSGTWSVKGNTVNTYVGGELYASYEIISVPQFGLSSHAFRDIAFRVIGHSSYPKASDLL